jgi:hypothetical protein
VPQAIEAQGPNLKPQSKKKKKEKEKSTDTCVPKILMGFFNLSSIIILG